METIAMTQKKLKYLKKTVRFGGDDLTLFSLDGNTWSSRKEELHTIHERHENEKVTFNQIKGGMAKKKPAQLKEGEPGEAAEAGEESPLAEERKAHAQEDKKPVAKGGSAKIASIEKKEKLGKKSDKVSKETASQKKGITKKQPEKSKGKQAATKKPSSAKTPAKTSVKRKTDSKKGGGKAQKAKPTKKQGTSAKKSTAKKPTTAARRKKK